MNPNGYEEFVEKVLPKMDSCCCMDTRPCACPQCREDDRQLLREALTSGLLCNGKELEEAKNELKESNFYLDHNRTEVASLKLKLKLSEAEKLVKPMTVEEWEELLRKDVFHGRISQPNICDKTFITDVAKRIHEAQMRRGEK